MRVLDLFSGIGSFSLGLERAGMKTVAFCEIDPFCRRVLAKHWPEVRCYDDVRTLTAERLAADGISFDVICGGFPCQDISVAGRGAGITGERSGLWREYARLIGEVGPRYVIVENVAALLGRGLGDVLGDLASLGFDAEWHCIPASAVGAPHIRDRIWIVAYPTDDGVRWWGQQQESCKSLWDVAYAYSEWLRDDRYDATIDSPRESKGETEQRQRLRSDVEPSRETVAYTNSQRLPHSLSSRLRQELALSASNGWWRVEPDVGRVAHGVANRVDRLRGLGNALVPQIPELIGRAIMDVAA